MNNQTIYLLQRSDTRYETIDIIAAYIWEEPALRHAALLTKLSNNKHYISGRRKLFQPKPYRIFKVISMELMENYDG